MEFENLNLFLILKTNVLGLFLRFHCVSSMTYQFRRIYCISIQMFQGYKINFCLDKRCPFYLFFKSVQVSCICDRNLYLLFHFILVLEFPTIWNLFSHPCLLNCSFPNNEIPTVAERFSKISENFQQIQQQSLYISDTCIVYQSQICIPVNLFHQCNKIVLRGYF